MELRLYLDILRRRWWIVVAIPLLVALISSAIAATRPARYGLTTRVLITRGAAGDSSVGISPGGDDTTALDLPAVLNGVPFRRDLAQELALRRRPINEAALVGVFRASNENHVVTISVEAASPDDAVAIVESAIALIERNGLRYWGDRRAMSANPGVNVSVLDPPRQAVRLNGPRATALDVGLRAMLGLIAAVGLAFALYYLETGRRSQVAGRTSREDGPATSDQRPTTNARSEL